MKCPNCGIDPDLVTSGRCSCPQIFALGGTVQLTPPPWAGANFICAICGGYGFEHNAYIHNLDERVKTLEKKGGA